MEIHIGTSGWLYPWNPKKSLRWYVDSGFDAVEVNSTFYRFPSEGQVKKWKEYKLLWSVKVNRLITHVKRLTDLESWRKFREVVDPLNPDFYLFQMPPSFKFSEENLERVETFQDEVGEKMAIEFRDLEWYRRELSLHVTVVSVDSPMGVFLVKTSSTVYLRMHGRSKQWYAYSYNEEEMREDLTRIAGLSPQRAVVFFNNYNMFQNSLTMREIASDFSGNG
ncbi:DUF72 domain-containing protein [Sulfuracidifex tepidarius]|uniref:DUF72 domain-containing protein n=1 Tax=Sulfuracidifex tepidarius TaxID=1294262 RepID=A0A510DTD6_9CREN|nr:DUF72 domain-containing protein [Sulfuracidifex tepidarius]BBG23473.1 hypothetical protein IC006_0757 [Sulfuracidifex tepidarius]BBG26226.1 hypothetical protein IC007_0731 [Sulfuracidifex tepidarius]